MAWFKELYIKPFEITIIHGDGTSLGWSRFDIDRGWKGVIRVKVFSVVIALPWPWNDPKKRFKD